MDGETFRSRLLKLLQKSRQAFRLYSSMERMPRNDSSEYTELQAAEWRTVNAGLVKELSSILDLPAQRDVSSHVFSLRERLLHDLRSSETELGLQQRELIGASEKADFVKAALLSRQLVSRKASVQAYQAAYHELDEALLRSKVVQPEAPIELDENMRQSQMPNPVLVEERQMAQVIPLFKR